MPGPFHRLESPTQTIADALLQKNSMEMWGKAATNTFHGSFPCVKAYKNTLPSGQRGVEFDTPVATTPGSSSRFDARWYDDGKTKGVLKRKDAAGTDFAAIPLSRFLNRQP